MRVAPFLQIIMRLRQIRIDFVPEADRLLLRIATDDEAELRFWLTRRYVRNLWPAIIKMIQAIGAAREHADPETRKALVEFEHDKAVRQADFATPYQGAKHLPLGEEPLLVSQLRAGPDGKGNVVVAMHPTKGQGIDLTMDSMLLHSFTRLLQGAVAKTDWDLDVQLPKASIPVPANGTDGRRLN